MSIVIIRGPEGPHAGGRTHASSLPGEVLAALVERAASAGTAIAIRTCASVEEFASALGISEREGAELIVADPGAHAGRSMVAEAMRALRVPYIEVHDDGCDPLEPQLEGDAGRRIAVVHGYAAQGYMLAMSKALEHLGYAEREFDYHVGI